MEETSCKKYYVRSRTKRSFWSLNSPRWVNRKNTRKNMTFWPLNPYYKRYDQKPDWQKAFLKFQHLSFKKKKNTCCRSLQKWSEIELCSSRMVLSRIFDKSIYVATWNLQEKIKSTIPPEQNHAPWLVKNSKTIFNKLTQQISLSVSGEQASRQTNTWPLASFLKFLDTFQSFRLLF